MASISHQTVAVSNNVQFGKSFILAVQYTERENTVHSQVIPLLVKEFEIFDLLILVPETGIHPSDAEPMAHHLADDYLFFDRLLVRQTGISANIRTFFRH